MEENDHVFHLNFSITLFNHGDVAESRRRFAIFEELFERQQNAQNNDDQEQDQDVLQMKEEMENLLKYG